MSFFQPKGATKEGTKEVSTKRFDRKGLILLENGIHEIKLSNGALQRIFASSHTPYPWRSRRRNPNWEWAFGYLSRIDIFNSLGQRISYAGNINTSSPGILPDNANIDIMMTHGPRKYQLDWSWRDLSLGCPHLFRASRRARPKLHVFGHIHERYGAQLVRWKNIDEVLPEDDDVDDGIFEKIKLSG